MFEKVLLKLSKASTESKIKSCVLSKRAASPNLPPLRVLCSEVDPYYRGRRIAEVLVALEEPCGKR